MKGIHVIAVPPMFASKRICEQFVGLEMRLASDEELRVNPPSRLVTIGGGYLVPRAEAVEALRKAGRDAADFWRRPDMGDYIDFAKRSCELIDI